MRSDHVGNYASGRNLKVLPSPRMSEMANENFGGSFGNKYISDSRSIKTTKTAVLKEMDQNEPRLTHFMTKRGIMMTGDSRFNGKLLN